MSFGPVQLLVVGFDGSGEFKGEIMAELRRAARARRGPARRPAGRQQGRRRQRDGGRDLSDLSAEERSELGALAALAGRLRTTTDDEPPPPLPPLEEEAWYVRRRDPPGDHGRDRRARAPLGDPAARRHRRRRRQGPGRRLAAPVGRRLGLRRSRTVGELTRLQRPKGPPARALRRSEAQNTVAQSFFMLTTVQPSAAARSSACSAPEV